MTVLSWMATRSADRHTVIGSVALRLAGAQADGQPTLAPVAGLRVRDLASARFATWHSSTGVYGFIDLPPGPRTFRVDDPEGRWLARLVDVISPDRSALRQSLESGAVAPVDAGPTWVDAALRPTVSLAIPPAETVLWGVVTRADVPVVGAFVRVVAGPLVYRGATGPDGTWCVWLIGLRADPSAPDPTSVECDVRVWAPAAVSVDPALPARFDDVNPTSAGFAALYPGGGTALTPSVPVGARLRVDFTLP